MEVKADSDKYKSSIDEYIASKKSTISTVVASVESETIVGYDAQLEFVDSIKAMDDHVSAVYIAYNDESLVYSGGWKPDEGFVITDRPWYVGASESDDVFITEPYLDEVTGGYCITIAKRVMKDNSVSCVVGLDLYLDSIISLVSDSFDGQTYSFLATKSGAILVHPNSKYILSPDNDKDISTVSGGCYKSIANNIGSYKYVIDYDKGIKAAMGVACNEVDWNVYTVIPGYKVKLLAIIMLGVNIVILIVAIIASRMACKKAIHKWFDPINSISIKVREIAEGNLGVEFNEDKITDEIDRLTTSLNSTVVQLRQYIQDISNVVEGIAQNDLTVSSKVDYRGEFVSIKEGLETITEKLNEAFMSIDERAEIVVNHSGQLQESTTLVASGATEQNEAISGLTEQIEV